MTHTARTRILFCLLLAAGAALLGGCPKSEKPTPAPTPSTLLGQSVPDEFDVPKPQPPATAVKVKQGETLTFKFHVDGRTGDAPVPEVTLLLTTNAANSPFGKANTYIQKGAAAATSYTFKVDIDKAAPPGTYTVKACLSPFIFPPTNAASPAVQEFTLIIESSSPGTSPGSAPGE